MLLEKSTRKRSKPNCANLKTQYGLKELILLLHYGIRGPLHNAPFEGTSWKIEGVISEGRANLARDSGHFDRVFLYLAYTFGATEELADRLETLTIGSGSARTAVS